MANMEEAYILCHIFEATARGMEIDYAELGGNPQANKADYQKTFDKLVCNIKVIQSKTASSKWPKDFTDKLARTMVTHPYTFNYAQKSAVRGNACCMACNKMEDSNFKGVSAFGFCPKIPLNRSFQPFTRMEFLGEDYGNYIDSYNKVLKDADDRRVANKKPHPQDGGLITAGETCTNRIFLYNMATNFIFNWIFIAHGFIQDKQHQREKISSSKLYVTTEEDATRLHKSFIMMQQLSAKEVFTITSDMLALDLSYIAAIKKIRARSLYDNTLHGVDRIMNVSAKLGELAKKPWAEESKPYCLEREPTAPAELPKQAVWVEPSGLVEALKTHLADKKDDSDSSDDSSGDLEELDETESVETLSVNKPVEKPVKNRKRKIEVGLTVVDPKRAKLIAKMTKIQQELVKSEDHETALTILQAIVELKQ